MPFLKSSGNRKKKSYITNDAAASAKRRDMVKQKLYTEHFMMDDDDDDGYLQLQVAPVTPLHQHQRQIRMVSPSPPSRSSSPNNRTKRMASPNYIDPSGELAYRKPVQRTKSDSTGRPAQSLKGSSSKLNGAPLPPRRAKSSNLMGNLMGKGVPESMPSPTSTVNARFSMTPNRRPPQLSRQMSHRVTPRTAPPQMPNRMVLIESDEDEDENSDEMPLISSMPPPRIPPQRRRRNTVATQSLQKSADAAMRFAPPRRVKSHYPVGNNPTRSNFKNFTSNLGNINDFDPLDSSEHSFGGNSNIGGKAQKKEVRRGLFRRRSGQSDDTEDTASSSDRSTSFFRNVKRTASNPAKLKKISHSLRRTNSNLNMSDHSNGSQSQGSWFSRQSAPADTGNRNKEDIYNSALARAKKNQAFKNHVNMQQPNYTPGRGTLGEQLSALPRAADSDEEYDEVDDKETKSFIGSLISKIENIYDDCS